MGMSTKSLRNRRLRIDFRWFTKMSISHLRTFRNVYVYDTEKIALAEPETLIRRFEGGHKRNEGGLLL